MKCFSLLIIGDEILNGRRKDRHLQNTIQLFEERGLSLYRSLIIGDDTGLIIDTIRYLNDDKAVVFVFGGIGATPDDHTRQCAAKAFDVPLTIHAEGRRLLEKKFAEKAYPHRIHMVTIPEGSRLIPNPYNDIPGFSYENFHFVPGFPQMAMPMVAWVLDNEYSHLKPVELPQRKTIRVYGKGEGELVDMMNELLQQFTEIKLSCLPVIDVEKTYVELSILAQEQQVDKACRFIIGELNKMQLEWE